MSLLLFLASILGLNLSKFIISNETYVTGEDKVFVKKLENTLTNESVSIVYSVGGRLESLYLLSKSENKLINVLYGHNNNATTILANPFFKGCTLIPWANRIENGTYQFYDKTYNLPINEPARNDSLHGFIYNRTMNVSKQIINNSYARLELSYRVSKEDGTDYPGYPFRFEIHINYTLNSTGFHINIRAKNIENLTDNINNQKGGRALPFYMGWHPYFRVNNISNTIVKLDDNFEWLNILSKGEDQDPQTATLIPAAKVTRWTHFNGVSTLGYNQSSGLPNYYDNGLKAILKHNEKEVRFVYNKIIDPDLKNTMVLYQEHNKFRYNQIFTGLYQKNNQMAVAFEPQSGETNAYNSGDELSVLYPQQIWEGTFGFIVE